jgi:aromatic-L-amino-acid/L-tryptophan decarboxylase
MTSKAAMVAELTLDSNDWEQIKAPRLAVDPAAPTRAEEQVIRWMAESMRLPPQSGGLLLGGGTLANILALAVARYSICGFDVRKYGVYGGARRLTVYGSSETRTWAERGLVLLGLGTESWRSVGTRDFRIDVAALRRQIAEDRRGGFQPLCVVGTAGAIATGASDDLNELAQVCSEEGVWFHVDGGFGALAQWSERLRGRVVGIERADSVAFDLHRWAYKPFAIACLLVRNGEMHRKAFASSASFADLGIELTHEFRALKLWTSLKAQGASLLTSVMEQNVDRATELARFVGAHPELELLVPARLNVVCFRYAPPDCADPSALNAVNEALLAELQEQGTGVSSGIVLDGRFGLRCAFVDYRTRSEDVAQLVSEVIRLGMLRAKEQMLSTV